MTHELKHRLEAFVQLGLSLNSALQHQQWPGFGSGLTEQEFNELRQLMATVHQRNGWFTEESVHQALSAWSNLLDRSSLEAWIKPKEEAIGRVKSGTVGIICAGNIPLVGFHDVLSTLITGHTALIKLSSDDDVLIPALLQILVRLYPPFEDKIRYASGKMEAFNAVIATGSTNTSRYFHQYFGNYPHIIRKGRTSVAIIRGNETPEELSALGRDIFDYFGLGCRSVSKIFIPRAYDLNNLFAAIYDFHPIVNHNKYANNYDYNKAVWLLNREDLLDNGFILLKEDTRLASPTASLFYEYYDDTASLEERLEAEKEQLQCIVSHGQIPFGKSQQPGLADYADNVDTLAFLTEQDHWKIG